MNNLEAEAKVAEFQDYKEKGDMNMNTQPEQRYYLEDINPQSFFVVGHIFNYDDLAESWTYSNEAGDWYTTDVEEVEFMQELLNAIDYCNYRKLDTTECSSYDDVLKLAYECGFEG